MSKIGLNATAAATEETRNALSAIKVQTAPVNVGDSSHEELIPEDAVDITIGVYFDGTQNNRKNIEAKEEHKKGALGDQNIAKHYDFQGGSFDNDYSNVSRAEPFYVNKTEEKHKQMSIYIEGVGTDNYEKDNMILGVALGKGDTGVIAKVKKGCEEAASKIDKALAGLNTDSINRLTIDTYGFSRGAAAARNFVHEITQRTGAIKKIKSSGSSHFKNEQYKVDYGRLGAELAAYGWNVKILTVRFVGLYDTVASYGINHDRDTKELNLDAINKARHVFQIGADDEYRLNFRRTDIKSAGTKGKEVLFPGVHSDIGGGYTDGAKENLVVDIDNSIELEKERLYLIDQGWYRADKINIDEGGWGKAKLIAERASISNKYSYIPLHTMTDYGMSKSVEYEISNLKDKYKIEGKDLIAVQKKLDDYVWGYRDKVSYDNEADRELIKRLRYGYFHFSAHYKKAFVFTPNEPRFIDEKRVRRTNQG